MDFKEKIKSLVQQGELYRSQGLLNEAKASYEQAIHLIQDQPNVKDAQKVIEGLRHKLGQVDRDIAKILDAPPPKVPPDIQELIKRRFAFATDDDARALEGAIALAKFGQFENALDEFNVLLDRPALRVDAAKNIIRCHIALKDIDNAVSSYQGWLGSELFNSSEILRINMFLENMLKKEGIDRAVSSVSATKEVPATDAVPEPKAPLTDTAVAGATFEAVVDEAPADEEEILEINVISFVITENRRPKNVELVVSFQSGNTISILVPGRDKLMTDFFMVGATIEDVQFFSDIAIFNGKMVVLSMTRIDSGPRRGDHSVELKVIPT